MTGGTGDAGPGHTDTGLALTHEVEATWPGIGEALSVAVNGRGSAGFRFFDSPASLAEADSDGHVIGLDGKAKSKRDEASIPAIIYSPEFTWVKCAHEVTVATGGEGERVDKGALGRAGLKGGGEGDLRVAFGDYRRFDAPVEPEAAMSTFFARPRLAVRAPDVRALGVGEALTFTVGGKLTAKIALRWSDIFTTEIGLLTELLGRFGERETVSEEEPEEAGVIESAATDAAEDEDESGDPLPTLGIRTRLSLYAVFEVGLEDTFRLVFSRAGEDSAVRVSVRKTDSVRRRTRLSPRLNVSLVDGDLMEEALDGAVEGLLGASPGWVRRMLKVADWAALNEVERALLGGVADRLGIGIDMDAVGTLADLRDAVEEVTRRAREILLGAARAKVTAALSFEYSSIDTDETIFEAELDAGHPEFPDLHSALVLGQLGDLVSNVSPAAVTVHRFLNQHSFECKRAWGASLNVGPFRAGGKDRLDVKQVRRTDMIGNASSYSFRGVRAHKGLWMRDGFSWKATLSARSPTERESKRGRTQLVTSLYLLIERDEREISEDELSSSLDSAVAWGILDPEAVPETAARFSELARGAESVDLSLHLRLGDVALRRVLAMFPGVGNRELARALAEALPWHPLFPARQRPSIRRQLYAGLWLHYLGSNPQTEVAAFASSAAGLFSREKLPELAAYEAAHDPPRYGSFAEMIRANPKTWAQWDHCRAGASALMEAVATEDRLNVRGPDLETADVPPDSMMASPFRDLSRAWSQSHHFRAFGVLVRHMISSDTSAWRDVRRTLRLGYRRDGERTVENITSRASTRTKR